MSGEDSPREHRKRRESSSRRQHRRKSTSHNRHHADAEESGSGGAQPLSPDPLARDAHRARERGGERVRDRTRERIRERTRERTRERERERERDGDEERDEEDERTREMRRQLAREWERSRQQRVEDTGRDRTRERPRERERERDRERDRSKRQDRQRAVDASRERERERDRERNRDRESRPRPEKRQYKEVDRGEGQKRPKEKSGGMKKRVVSGALMEEGRSKGFRGLRGGGWSSNASTDKMPPTNKNSPEYKRKRKKILMGIGVGVVLVIVLIIVAAVVSTQKEAPGENKSSLNDISKGSIPPGAPSYLDPFQWQDTKDFNLTYTAATVGDLPVMGLFSSWDDSKQANDKVPPLNKPWGSYASRPARGVNLGGWLSIEPFITADLYNWDAGRGVIDEWTMCRELGSSCAGFLEKHYASFVTEQTFADIAAAGLDHVRIPFGYWAVQTYDGDSFLFRTSWRYLLRGIEWARKYGLRINLDLHGLPGSQNGWNHSGRQGTIGWLNGADGTRNAQRSLDIHDRLSKFFAQDRYRNIISHYGLANEPKMTSLSTSAVVDWTSKAFSLVRGNGIRDAVIVFGDGFMGLHKWQGQLTGHEGLALDVHQYVIFNVNQIVFNHSAKIQYACDGWTKQTQQSMDTTTGFGPTMVAEWSQADTDCARHLTNVGQGNRWTGTYKSGDPLTEALTPRCPAQDSTCDCAMANADPSRYSDAYKAFLRAFAEAQMHSFEKGWGWFYWTWDASHAQWSYKKGLAAGILPPKAYERSFNCDLSKIPSFAGLPETY